MATKTLYLIRHGRTEADGVKRYKGSIDVPLAREGEEEIGRAAKFIRAGLEAAGRKMDALYCSSLIRARRSAEIICGDLGLEPVEVPEFRERHFGQWEGMTFDEIEARWPGTFKAWASDPLRHSPVGGESSVEVGRRANEALDRILERHDGGTIAVVAHGGVNRVILCRLLGVSLENMFRMEQDHGCVNIIEFYDEYPVVKLLNWKGRL